MNSTTSIAWFITPHGFGHAARASAVMNAISERDPTAHFEIFTAVPEWVFADSIRAPFKYHHLVTDVGVKQKNALEEDLGATVEALNRFYPLDCDLVTGLAYQLRRDKVQSVFCDIAPLGLEVSREAGLPSFLIENFTWDWIYSGYFDYDRRLKAPIDVLAGLFSRARYHIQTTPACDPRPVDLSSEVVSRKPRQSRGQVRAFLGIEANEPVVLITMGGIEEQYPFLEKLKQHPDVRFVIPAAADRFTVDQNLVLLPHHTPVYHPDIVHASDVVVGKLGYSTLGEVYQAGIPYAYIPRPRFRETEPLAAFVQKEMEAVEVPARTFANGEWIVNILDLLNRPVRERRQPNGADTIAEFVLSRL